MAASMVVGKQTSDTDGGSGGLLLSACRRHLPPSRGGGRSTFAPSRSAGKRRRLEEQQQQLPGAQNKAAGEKADGSTAANATGGLAVGSSNASGSGRSSGKTPRTGPFRVLLTTGKTPSSADTAVGSATTSSSKGNQNREAATAAGSARLLSSVAMDLAHSLALQSFSSSSSSSSSLLPCRGCGANNGTSNQQCQCVDVVYILHASAASAGGDEEGHADNYAEEEEVGADLFPLRCRRVDDSSMVDDSSNDNDNDDADDGADPATNSRSSSSSSSQSSSPSWDEGALSRIQIRRMRDRTDLVRYLATVPLLPPHQQPLKGIVLNDIGSFVLGNVIHGNGGGGGGGTVGNGSSAQSVTSSLGPSYYTIDSSTVLTQIRKSKYTLQRMHFWFANWS